MAEAAIEVEVAIPGRGGVDGLWIAPPHARAALVLAHGAGAGMRHAGMAAIADGLADHGIATLRFQFPYMQAGGMQAGGGPPDRPPVAQAAVRAACAAIDGLAPALPLFAGGRSFGGRMTTEAQAALPLPGVRGLVLFAFPLHPAGKPGDSRARHLAEVGVPMLFLQGTRDALAEMTLLRPALARLGERANLATIADADHSFHVRRSSGRGDAEAMAELVGLAAAWMIARAAAGPAD
ncbi:MAG: alpha/beta family hydrolase [Alphaproteobacteria bacterium]